MAKKANCGKNPPEFKELDAPALLGHLKSDDMNITQKEAFTSYWNKKGKFSTPSET